MARRAPAGSAKTFKKVANFIRKQGASDAALYLGVSERRAAQILSTVDKGKPLSSIITSKRGLEQWQEKIKIAPQLQKNRAAYEVVQRQRIATARIAQQAGLTQQEVSGALSFFQSRIAVPEHSKEIRKAIDDLKFRVPYYSDHGFIVCPGGEEQARLIQGAENGRVYRTGFRTLEDADEYCDVVFGSAREFFFILEGTDSQGRTRYSVYDIRPAGTREMPKNFTGLAGFKG